jgi:hypothetical protein
MIRIVYRNPLERWGEHTYNEPWISVTGIGGPLVVANHPGLIRHVLVTMPRVQDGDGALILRLNPARRPADCRVKSGSARATMAPVSPRHIFGFARRCYDYTLWFVTRYESEPFRTSPTTTLRLSNQPAEALFSGEIAGERRSFGKVDRLFETMGRTKPLDLLPGSRLAAAPDAFAAAP